MNFAGSIADWALVAGLLVGLALASWAIYAWALREPKPERARVPVRQEDLETAA